MERRGRQVAGAGAGARHPAERGRRRHHGGRASFPIRSANRTSRSLRSILNRAELTRIATAGGGRYYELDRETDREIANQIIDQTRRRAGTTGIQEGTHELYWNFLFAAGSVPRPRRAVPARSRRARAAARRRRRRACLRRRRFLDRRSPLTYRSSVNNTSVAQKRRDRVPVSWTIVVAAVRAPPTAHRGPRATSSRPCSIGTIVSSRPWIISNGPRYEASVLRLSKRSRIRNEGARNLPAKSATLVNADSRIRAAPCDPRRVAPRRRRQAIGRRRTIRVASIRGSRCGPVIQRAHRFGDRLLRWCARRAAVARVLDQQYADAPRARLVELVASNSQQAHRCRA